MIDNFSTVHVDVDNLWITEEEFAIPQKFNEDILFSEALPRALEQFEKHNILATFFIVGRDIQLESCREFLSTAAKKGHRFGNHTFSHRSDFWSLSYREKEQEIVRCHHALEEATNTKVVGFRSPGYFLDDDIFKILTSINYYYDTSVFPGFYTQLLKYYMMLSGSKDLSKKFGMPSFIYSSRKAYNLFNTKITEFPIYTFSPLRIPTHSSVFFLLPQTIQNIFLKGIKFDYAQKVLIFHGIDWMNDLPALKGKHPIASIRLSNRLTMIDQLLNTLNNTKKVLLEDFFQKEGLILQESNYRISNL
jgi:peptidoglycan/xylan/chitin deacetylase (PgdA/CDA1 family)